MKRNTKEWHDAVLAQQIEITERVLSIKVKYMWSWLAKVWSYGAFILGRTIYLKRSLSPLANQGLIAHDSIHIIDKRKIGYVKYFFRYMFNKDFRARIEARGYAMSVLIATKQGRDRNFAIDWYADALATRYKLKISKEEARIMILFSIGIVEWEIFDEDSLPVNIWLSAKNKVQDAHSTED